MNTRRRIKRRQWRHVLSTRWMLVRWVERTQRSNAETSRAIRLMTRRVEATRALLTNRLAALFPPN